MTDSVMATWERTTTPGESGVWIGWLPWAAFAQMLPAMLLMPAVRPLFADRGAPESAMHAFMSLNMLGAALAAPWVARRIDRARSRRALLATLCVLDAVLIALMATPLPIAWILALRTLEGASHVGALSVLMTEAAARAQQRTRSSLMGAMGAGIMAAVAAGSALGALLVHYHWVLPFLLAAVLSLSVGAVASARMTSSQAPERPRRADSPRSSFGDLWVPLGGAFVARFSVGCLVVTFALFAHRVHGLDDRTIGLLFSCMTVTFAALTYPATWLGRRSSTALVLLVGALAYALALALLPLSRPTLLWWAMVVGGAGSAGILGAILCYLGELPKERRAQGMAWFNGLGCLGMLLGPAVAGIVSAALRSADDPSRPYRVVFQVAASSILLWVAVASSWLLSRTRSEVSQRLGARSMHAK